MNFKVGQKVRVVASKGELNKCGCYGIKNGYIFKVGSINPNKKELYDYKTYLWFKSEFVRPLGVCLNGL